MAGHRIVLAYNCLEVAAKLGGHHRAVQRQQPGEGVAGLEPHSGDSGRGSLA